MKKFTRVLLTLVSFAPVLVFSKGWLTSDGSAKISSISVENGIVKVRYTANDILDPDGCNNNGVAVLTGEDKNSDRQFSLLLAAQMSDKPIKLYTTECWNGWNQKWPKVWMVSVD